MSFSRNASQDLREPRRFWLRRGVATQVTDFFIFSYSRILIPDCLCISRLLNPDFSMRILLIADIHANWPALAAINERFDACLFLGDVVDYATEPLPCIEWVRKYATASVRGNHDHSVAQRVMVKPGGTFRRMAAAMRPRHFEVLDDEKLTWLAQLPVTRYLTLGDHRFLLVHATPRDPMDEYLGDSAEQWQQSRPS